MDKCLSSTSLLFTTDLSESFFSAFSIERIEQVLQFTILFQSLELIHPQRVSFVHDVKSHEKLVLKTTIIPNVEMLMSFEQEHLFDKRYQLPKLLKVFVNKNVFFCSGPFGN